MHILLYIMLTALCLSIHLIIANVPKSRHILLYVNVFEAELPSHKSKHSSKNCIYLIIQIVLLDIWHKKSIIMNNATNLCDKIRMKVLTDVFRVNDLNH